MKKPTQLLLIAALALSLSLNGMVVLAQDKTAPETSSAVTVETKDGETEKKPDAKEAEQQESGQKETSSQQTTSETPSSSQAAESSQTTANSGTYENVTWKIDAQAKTLVLSQTTQSEYVDISTGSYQDFPWYGRESEFSKLQLKGYVRITGNSSKYFLQNVDTVEGTVDGINRYIYNNKTKTLTLDGQGNWTSTIGTEWPADNLVIGNEITLVDTNYEGYKSVHIGAKAQAGSYIRMYTQNSFSVESGNPYYSVYENCLYSKDFTMLIATPQQLTSYTLHPSLENLASYTIRLKDGAHFVMPWGVRIMANNTIMGNNVTVVLPDTISDLPPSYFENDTNTKTYIVSQNNNSDIKAKIYNNSVGGKITVQVVDSVAKYYPGKVGPEGGETSTVPGPSGEPESSQPSPGPSGGTSQPTTSKPTTSQPSTSKPATSQPSTSKPATSQPTSRPATSQPAPSQPVNQPESSVPIESSQPAASSQPEDKLSESSGESLELSIEPSSEAGESTIAPVENKATGGWVVPVVVLVIAAAVAAGVVVLRMRKR